MNPLEEVNAQLRRLPKVDEVLRGPLGQACLARAPRWAVVEAVRAALEDLRQRVRAAPPTGAAKLDLDERDLARRVDELTTPSLRRVINATGVVLHTNLGRAPLAAAAWERLVEIARGYCNLEYRLDERGRGSRHHHVTRLLTDLTGAEASLVVNNGAAAALLALATLAAGREVIVSRGELVEIGGSFRIPDVLRASGARLVEVGTTNRTHLDDYVRAIAENTGLLLKVHRSNFAIIGFTAEAGLVELARLAGERHLPLMVDLGSGALAATRTLGLRGEEPTPGEVIAAGADLVTFSGDKLLGGPQAGILLGRRQLIEQARTHPLLRALRPDKLTLAALEATLELYRDGRTREIPVMAMLGAPPEQLRARAAQLEAQLRALAPGLGLTVIETRSAVGGGALPLDEPASWALALTHAALDAEALDRRLRQGRPPLIGRIAEGRLILDVRTLSDEEVAMAAAACAAIDEKGGSGRC